jgi:hypothetical protein
MMSTELGIHQKTINQEQEYDDTIHPHNMEDFGNAFKSKVLKKSSRLINILTE